MAYGKWIGAWIGGMSGGILGALAGFALGSLFDNYTKGDDNIDQNKEYDRKRQEEGERNGFLFSLMVLSAHIIQSDGRIMHSEMEAMRNFLRYNFGETAAIQGDMIIKRIFEYRKRQGEAIWQQQIEQACTEMRMAMPEEHRLQLLTFLAGLAKADGSIVAAEIDAMRRIAQLLGLQVGLVDQLLSLGGDSLEDAYKVLGITPDATNDEVRRAYRELVKKYHPDRVATLGNDIVEAAKQQMQKINEAKDRIYKARNL